MFFHIRISEKSNTSHDETRVDLSEEELWARYISQYEAGEPIIINGKTISPDDIERVRVSRSDNPSGSSHKCMHDSGMISPITRRPQDEE